MNWIDDPTEQQRIISKIVGAIFHVSSVYTFPTLNVPIELANRLKRFADTSSGFTSDTPPYDNFMRMLYFSVVTATTLGYGDIVPVTTTARNLIISECLFGVMLAGLFVNALFGEHSQLT